VNERKRAAATVSYRRGATHVFPPRRRRCRRRLPVAAATRRP